MDSLNFNSLAELCIQVIKDWRIIASAIGTVIFISLANYVVKYKKRPPVVKHKPVVAAQPKKEAPAEDEGKEAE